MAYGKRQRRRYTRRSTGQTDYHRRLKLLRSGTPRAVVRITNTQVICQLVSYQEDGDLMLIHYLRDLIHCCYTVFVLVNLT